MTLEDSVKQSFRDVRFVKYCFNDDAESAANSGPLAADKLIELLKDGHRLANLND